MKPMVSWSEHEADICASIRANPSELKILLKTKDDAFFLREWIEHHRKIVGIENLIVFDNNSTDSSVIDVYAAYSDQLLVVSFEGFHNYVHDVSHFPGLYNALAASCRFYTFLDTDEFLGFFDGENFLDGEAVREHLPESRGAFIPAVWLYNYPGYRDRFILGDDASTFRNGVAWGKPIISAAAPVRWNINHNCQIAGSQGVEADPMPGYFLFHYAQLSPKQRIRANLNKLVARGYLAAGSTIDDVIGLDTSGQSDNIKLYVSEISYLATLPELEGALDAPLTQGTFRLSSERRPVFFSPREKGLFQSVLENFSEICEDVLGGQAR
ncbi:glycosyltransferase family 2 protein [Methylobacterium nigriterrae]|uniref:glycosyltransferase family 2 protein n=1 Tax=Methylobacterium nigriterrae TaxID=3127512 RepID=UPI00301408BC